MNLVNKVANEYQTNKIIIFPQTFYFSKEEDAQIFKKNFSKENIYVFARETFSYNLLRNELGFTGVIITDDLAMGAVSSIKDNAVKAVLAGNDLLITTDYDGSFTSIKDAISNGTVSESLIDRLAFRVLAWKYYKGLMFNNK